MTVNFIPVDKLGDASESRSTSSVLKTNTLKQSSINTVLQKENVTRAEIMWALEILMNNNSYRSCVGKDQLFTSMFPHSFIAQKFQLGKTKASYVICYGLAPFFKLNFLDMVKQTPYIVISFNESHSDVIKRVKWMC